MTSFWILSLGACILCALWLCLPFLRRTEVERDETDAALSIYRDQLDEVDRDLMSGLISAPEAEAARREIETRAVKAARNTVGGMSASRRSPVLAATIIALLCGGSLAGYAALGAMGYQDRPLAERKTEALVKRAQAGDIKSRIQLLVETVEKHPDSFEDWWLLARSYAASGDNASAADAYRRAAELSNNEPGVLSAYAEAMTLANGNKVPKAAKILFQQILTKSEDPRARYYLALSKAQEQDFEGALTDWGALAADSDPSAPWMQLVRRDIINMARFTETDVRRFLPDAGETEIAKAGGKTADADRNALTKQAAALNKALNAEPADYLSWLELAQVQSDLGETGEAKATLQTARRHFAAAPFILSKIDAKAADLGLDFIKAPPPSKKLSGSDIDAIQSLPKQEQTDLIEGMVAGLAAKLEENPNNPDGWAMLVRSYAHLGDIDKAEATFAKAKTHYQSNPDVFAKIEQEVGELIH